jgi:hypothetical protein
MLAVRLAVPIPKILWIEHIRINRDILWETDARHCQRPGAWQMRVHHDLSPLGLSAAGGSPLDETECTRKGPRRPWD